MEGCLINLFTTSSRGKAWAFCSHQQCSHWQLSPIAIATTPADHVQIKPRLFSTSTHSFKMHTITDNGFLYIPCIPKATANLVEKPLVHCTVHTPCWLKMTLRSQPHTDLLRVGLTFTLVSVYNWTIRSLFFFSFMNCSRKWFQQINSNLIFGPFLL